VYRIKFAPDYRDELADLEKRFPDLEQKLQGGIYFSLLGAPHDGRLQGDTGIWYMNQGIEGGRFLVKVYYRIRERPKTVTLISILIIDRTVM
jgi:hypothetical protein